MRSGAYVTLRAMAIVDSDGTLIACHWLPAYDVLPPHGAGVAARTPAVTPAALVITTSAAATVVRSDRTRTDGLSEAGREGSAGGAGAAAGPTRSVHTLCLHAGLSDRLHHAPQVVEVLLERDTLERLGLRERRCERVEHGAVVLEQHPCLGLRLGDQPADGAVH